MPDLMVPPAEAALIARNPVTNARAILRYALPIKNKQIVEVQDALEEVTQQLRVPGSKSLGPIGRNVRRATELVSRNESKIKADFVKSKSATGSAAIESLKDGLTRFNKVVADNDKQTVPIIQQECLSYVGDIEESMLEGLQFPIPKEYLGLPTLAGRATIEMKVHIAEPGNLDLPLDGTMIIVVDGYNAPLSSGNFVDLVQRGFYDGMEVQRADGFVVQTGDPPGKAEGFVDETGKVRRIPLEIRAIGEKEIFYDDTFEDLGVPNKQPVLPFNAFGTMAMARAESENNSASSQVFWLLRESEITPASSNLLDGRYSVFGYVTDSADYIQEMKVGDKIVSAKVISGGEQLTNGGT